MKKNKLINLIFVFNEGDLIRKRMDYYQNYVDEFVIFDLKIHGLNYFDSIKNDANYLESFNKDMTYFQYLNKRYDCRIGGRNYHFLNDAQSEWAEVLEENIGRYIK